MTQGVEFNRLMLDMRAMQAEAMSQSKVAAAPELAPGQSSFADMLGQAIGKVNEVQQASTQLSNAFEIGKSGVDCGFHAIRPPSPLSSGQAFHGHLATCSTAIRPGSRSAATQGLHC
ncbi:flagellar hook-basal body complex protein FliE [Pseudomonas sp. BYT-1]|nr:flagellar hook-basal body complex protein FliE [Pseudomonas sp. BYT-1]